MNFLKNIGFLFVLTLGISTLLVSCGKGAMEDVELTSENSIDAETSTPTQAGTRAAKIGSGPPVAGSTCFRGTLLINYDCEWPVTNEVGENEDFSSRMACIQWGWDRKAELEALGHCVETAETHCDATDRACRQ